MLMHFLWLAYRKYEYKYSIIRWTWYIVIRRFAHFLISQGNLPIDYNILLFSIVSLLSEFFIIFDFLQFVYYSNNFYSHLKSREKEITLFYYDDRASHEIRYLRMHFKIATILVVIALFFYTLANSDDLIYYTIVLLELIKFPLHYVSLYAISDDVTLYILNPSGDISKILFI